MTSVQINKVLLAVMVIVPFSTFAQKLPKIQQSSVYTPATIKIDGKANEWNQKFEAYHPTNRIFYTVSNDNENLYLTVKATEAVAVKKIFVDGLTLTLLNNRQRKLPKGAEAITITYPSTAVTYTGIERAAGDYADLMEDSLINKDKITLLTNTTNRKILTTFQKIQVKGIKEITDSLTLKNSFGMQALAQFNKVMELTYELAVPLKYLGLNGSTVISYNMKLNGVPAVEKTMYGKLPQPIVQSEGHDGRVDYDQEYLNQPTDFWGVYTLAKKELKP